MAFRVSLLAVAGALSVGTSALAASGGAGASLPYVELQAEDAATDGAVVPVDYTYNTLAAEASGRSAVTLSAPGQFVEFTVPAEANSIVVRYSIPDRADGTSYTVPLALFVAGERQPDLTLTTAYSHYYGAYPFTNGPKGGNHHHFFDEVATLLPEMAPGTVVRLEMAEGAASEVTIDLADFEEAPPPLEAPAGATVFVADTTGRTNVTNKLRKAVEDAAGGTLFLPAGTYLLKGAVPLVSNLTIVGAGMWHTTLNFDTQGPSGFAAVRPPGPATSNVTIADLRMTGNIQERVDSGQTNAFSGMFADTVVRNVSAEHFKVGAWLVGPSDNVRFEGVRIRDTTADGINFNSGFTHSVVTQSHIRNTGDDGLAMWSQQADTGNIFSFNTVELPILANGIAIYGGSDNTVSDNLVVDAGLTQGGGIHVGNRFGAPALAGTTTIARNTIVRSGSMDPNWKFGVGSLWFDARDSALTGKVEVTDLVVRQAPYSALMFVSGDGVGNVSFDDVTVEGAGTFVVQAQVAGSATFKGVTATGVGMGGVWNCPPGGFALTDGGGNGGWISDVVACSDPQPAPVFPAPAD